MCFCPSIGNCCARRVILTGNLHNFEDSVQRLLTRCVKPLWKVPNILISEVILAILYAWEKYEPLKSVSLTLRENITSTTIISWHFRVIIDNFFFADLQNKRIIHKFLLNASLTYGFYGNYFGIFRLVIAGTGSPECLWMRELRKSSGIPHLDSISSTACCKFQHFFF